ncbi:bifunctional riboflavin kinase/FAD synthetase [uncultured Brachyspira sp.]|uniref:bifunctional riboflavin kinase/FAD synthetase n=1 Tax=uncultured Brachyspira sp. TaxID=221953 RepID=UPI0025E1D9E8|nr:bifunctional riboflavin kinase/FAD synthetase [uncultured Brachyspira sp.]
MNQIINDFCKIDLKKDSIVTIGKFDSVHRGHQKLIKYTVDYAKKNNLISIALVIKKKNLSIYNTEDNNTFIKSLGINYIIVIDFLPEFYKMDAKEFFDKLIEYYRMKHIAVGSDFAFGKDRMGDSDFLKKYSKECKVGVSFIKFLKYKNDKISSSNIRECLSNGDMTSVNKMLGREYSINGLVVHGNALGRKIGYPTANLEMPKNIFIPKMGVYSSTVKIGSGNITYQALTFIGVSNINKELRVESHILDFSKMIYGKKITVVLLKYVRDNIKVNSIDEVKKLLENDEKKIRKYFKRRTKTCLSQQTKKQK